MDKARGRTLCARCEKLQDQERAQAKEAYAGLLRQAALGTVAAADVGTDLSKWRTAAALASAEQATLDLQILREAVETVLADDLLTQAEEDRLDALGELTGVSESMWRALGPEFAWRFLIARINDGRLPHVAVPKVLLKKNETAYLEVPAALMKEVIDRVRRGGYGGVSFPLGKGVRFNTGRFQSRSVVLGSHMEPADQGTLTLTSTRAVFLGFRKTVELPYAKLLSFNVFTDGIQFQMSNRQSAPLFRVPNGHLAAALVNAAYQKL